MIKKNNCAFSFGKVKPSKFDIYFLKRKTSFATGRECINDTEI
jgi:hypothetical protein